MFATFRSANDLDGEVVCVSSTDRPPQPGQTQNHSACDGCRSKKLKCTGQRFGCQRCRDRNLVCTYTGTLQCKKRKSRTASPCSANQSRLNAQARSLKGLRNLPTVERNSITVGANPLPGISEVDAQSKSSSGTSELSQADENVELSFGSQNLIRSSRSSSLTSNESLTAAPVSDDILQSAYGSNISDFDMSILGDEIFLSDQSPVNSSLPGPLNFSRYAEERTESQATVQMNDIDPLFSEMVHDFCNPKPKTSSRSTTPVRYSSPVRTHSNGPQTKHFPSITFQHESSNGRARASTPALDKKSQNSQKQRPIMFRPPSRYSSQCQCMDITLAILEKLQRHANISDLGSAEQYLYLLKRANRQCQMVAQCQECRTMPSLMTLSTLLIEKMVGAFEDVASCWDSEMKSLAQRNPSTLDPRNVIDELSLDDFQKSQGDGETFLLGEYQIDLLEERYYVFGFLILLQVRLLGDLLKRLKIRATNANWESHLAALRPADRRIRQLKETLGRMSLGVAGGA